MKNKEYTDFKELIELAASWTTDSEEVSCNIEIETPEGEIDAYTVSIAKRELLFYGKQGTAIFIVDNICGQNMAVIHDWELV